MNKNTIHNFFRIALSLIIFVSVASSTLIRPQSAQAAGVIRYAIPGGATSGSCTSWGSACELRYVLTIVAVSGDQIWVKAGTYKTTAGTDRSISFVLLNGVAIYGGFNGTETALEQRDPAVNVTILSGEIGNPETTDNSLHVVIGSGTNNTAILDGFTITAGNATNDKGGGMWNYGGSPTLKNLIFDANSAQDGGGIYNEYSSNPTLTNVMFTANNAVYRGGGMVNLESTPSLLGVTFSNNQVINSWNYGGGGIYNDKSSPTLNNVTFSANSADDGGGMYNYSDSNASLSNVIFIDNHANDFGGGMYNYYSNPTLTDVTFKANTVTLNDGGGMYNNTSSPTLTNVIFQGNTVSNGGGGMGNQNNSNSVLTNVTFQENTAGVGGGMRNSSSNPTLTDVTFIGNSASNRYDQGGGGMSSSGNPMLTNVTFSDNTTGGEGGGMLIYWGQPILNNVVFVNNTAEDGGGIYNGGYLTLLNATLNNNIATRDGGGLFNTHGDYVILTNVTFNGNSAGFNGGGINNSDNNFDNNPILTNVTLTANSAGTGGGMYNIGRPILNNVSFSGNTATTFAGGMYNTLSYNICTPRIYNTIFWNDGSEVYNNSCTPTISDSIVMGGCPSGSTCTNIINANPLLGPLQNNGGFTQTMALGAGSPAIDAGNDATCATTDQRGVTRPQGSHCDMGAYEVEGPPQPFNKSSPSNGATSQPANATLTWGTSGGAVSYEYCYDTSNDNECSAWINNGNSTSKSLNGLSPNTTYYWHVRAVNTLDTIYSNGSDTAYWSFTTGTVPGAFSKITPANGATGQSTSLALSWGTSAGATSYEYCYDTTNDNNCLTWSSNGSSTSKTLSGLSAGTTYYWHVRAVNTIGATYANGNVWWSFRTRIFADVPSTYWAWQFIERLYNAGITGGCSTSPLNYCPESEVTRAQMAVFLERGLHYPSAFTAPNVAPTFSDTVGHWAEDWIEALKSDGITSGCATGLYCPEAPVTRAQMAVFLLRAKYGSSYTPPVVGAGTGFADVPTDHWAAGWIKQLVAEGITSGCGGGNYCPEAPVTRAQMAVFLVRTFNLP